MQFLKRFYQPITLLLIVVAATFGLNRGESFDDKPPGEAAALVKKVDDVIAKLQRNEQPERISSTGQDLTAETGTDSADQPGQAEDAHPDVSGQANAPKQVGNETPAAGGTESRSAAQPISMGNTAGEEGAPPASLNSATQDSPVTAQSGTATSNVQSEVTPERIRQTWQQARLAAWQGELATAIEHYRTLVAQQPDNFDAYGEMGNVLLNSGDREGAAEAYYRAATLINNTPHRMMAWHLLNVLAWLAPEKADKLYQELLPRLESSASASARRDESL